MFEYIIDASHKKLRTSQTDEALLVKSETISQTKVKKATFSLIVRFHKGKQNVKWNFLNQSWTHNYL